MQIEPELESRSTDRVSEFLGEFQDDFGRPEQKLWASVYLHGLIFSADRKNIRTIAAAVTLPPGVGVRDPMQALQHFINQSPWDDARVAARCRSLIDRLLPVSERILVIDDVIIPKKGLSSVGVQRQFNRTTRRKVNCQIAVLIGYVVGGPFWPLALRLYLPRRWQLDSTRLEAGGVPMLFREMGNRPKQALDMLDGLIVENLSWNEVVTSTTYGTPEFLDALYQRGFRCSVLPTHDQGGKLESKTPSAQAFPILEIKKQGHARLLDELGLAHYEGRSWRGFHHHAVLAMLAYVFNLWNSVNSETVRLPGCPRLA